MIQKNSMGMYTCICIICRDTDTCRNEERLQMKQISTIDRQIWIKTIFAGF